MRLQIQFTIAFCLQIFFLGCAQIEPKDLSLLNHPSLDLNRSYASDSVTTVTGLKNFSAASGGGACTVCAH